jgi:hypothetical protein
VRPLKLEIGNRKEEKGEEKPRINTNILKNKKVRR